MPEGSIKKQKESPRRNTTPGAIERKDGNPLTVPKGKNGMKQYTYLLSIFADDSTVETLAWTECGFDFLDGYPCFFAIDERPSFDALEFEALREVALAGRRYKRVDAYLVERVQNGDGTQPADTLLKSFSVSGGR